MTPMNSMSPMNSMNPMNPILTVKLPLNPDAAQAAALAAAQELYRQACAWYAREMERAATTSRNSLHSVYPQACRLFPGLPPATLQLAAAKAAAALRSCQSGQNQGLPVSPPAFRRPLPLGVRRDYFKVELKGEGRGILQVLVLRGQPRLALTLLVPVFHQERLQAVARGEARTDTLELWRDPEGRWWAGVTVRCAVTPGMTAGWVGVDQGIARLGVTSNGAFFSGGPLRWQMTGWERRRAAAGRPPGPGQGGSGGRQARQLGHPRPLPLPDRPGRRAAAGGGNPIPGRFSRLLCASRRWRSHSLPTGDRGSRRRPCGARPTGTPPVAGTPEGLEWDRRAGHRQTA